MGSYATEAVFDQGTRLSVHNGSDDDDKEISSGDGAWIMQKCAKTLGGSCQIRFNEQQTVFSFRCKVAPYRLPWKVHENFQVPPKTWGVAFDDTHIQRKLMARILKYAGVDESRTVIRGQNPADIQELDKLLQKLLSADPTSKVLVLMDENLDYECDGVQRRLSGSSYSEKALKKLSPEFLSRTFLLVRSANDSDTDLAIYKSRTHGFFPKAAMQKSRVIELLAPAWLDRFPDRGVPDTITTTTKICPSEDCSAECGSTAGTEASTSGTQENCEGCGGHFSGGVVSADEMMTALERVDKLVSGEVENDWDTIWSKLHSFMGDMMAVEDNDNLQRCVELISEMRGRRRPSGLNGKWEKIRGLVLKEVASARRPCV